MPTPGIDVPREGAAQAGCRWRASPESPECEAASEDATIARIANPRARWGMSCSYLQSSLALPNRDSSH